MVERAVGLAPAALFVVRRRRSLGTGADVGHASASPPPERCPIAPTSIRERERKLDAPADFALPPLPGTPLAERFLESTYHDTDELSLARHGITLRHRLTDGNAPGAWQLKLPAGADRIELEQAGASDERPAELLDLVTAIVRDHDLRPVATLETRRIGVYAERDGVAVAEVVRDNVTVTVGNDPPTLFSELEVELLEAGEGADLERLVVVLLDAGASPSDGAPKLLRALHVSVRKRPPRARRKASPLEHVRAALAEQAFELVRRDPGTRLGQDVEELHSMRVAVRRSRAILRSARPLLDREWADELREELAWIGAELGEVRDLDVLIAYLASQIDLLPEAERADAAVLAESLSDRHTEVRERLLLALRSGRYLLLLEAMERAAEEPAASGSTRSLSKIAASEHRKLVRTVERLGDDPPDAALHAARIEAKRARYAGELAARAVGARADRYVEACKRLQDVLGAHQDAVVAEEWIEATARRVAVGERAVPIAFAAGRLAQLQVERRHDARRAWRAAWKPVAREGRRAWS